MRHARCPPLPHESLHRRWHHVAPSCAPALAQDDDKICSINNLRALWWPLFRFTIAAPSDALLWTDPMTSQWVPWVRLVRLAPLALIKIDAQMSELERSQTVPFMMARTVRIFYVLRASAGTSTPPSTR